MADERIEIDSRQTDMWATVYSDMMTVLMIFFLMLYGLSRMDADARQNIMKGLEKKFRGKTDMAVRAEKVIKKFTEEETAVRVSQLAKKEGLEDYASVEITEKHIKIILTAPTLFKSGSPQLSEFTKTTLSDVARIIKPVPNTVIIEGHTDNIPLTTGIYQSNWELSVARAYSVIDFFVRKNGISENRFVAAGYGEFRPVASNETAEGRAKNRRIEIVMIR